MNDRIPPADDTSNDSYDRQDDVLVGRITGAWGLRGHVKVEPLTDSSQRFSPGSSVYLNGQSVQVTDSRPRKDSLLVKFDRVVDRTQAESLRDAVLTVPAADVGPLPAGSYYHFQVLGIGVWTEGGEHIGRVTEILPKEGADVYVVRDGDRAEVLLLAVESVVVDVDLEEGRMVVRLPE